MITETNSDAGGGDYSRTLFDLPTVPRKRTNNKAAINRWKRENRIITHHNRCMEEPWTALAPKLTMDDVADRCVLLEETGEMVFGATEQEACERIAANAGISIPWSNNKESAR